METQFRMSEIESGGLNRRRRGVRRPSPGMADGRRRKRRAQASVEH